MAASPAYLSDPAGASASILIAVPLDTALFGTSLFDGTALAVVLLGTGVATLARVGGSDVALALRSAFALMRAGFDEDANRTALARWARAIRERGVLGAEAPMPADEDLTRGLKALLRTGSVAAMRSSQDDTCARHLRERGRAVRVFEQAGELAPVFGLVGTLFSMTQLAPDLNADGGAATLGAIATAVLSSLYGVLSAHFLFLPLAHAVARRAQCEEEAREALVDWLTREVAEALPGGSSPRVTALRRVA